MEGTGYGLKQIFDIISNEIGIEIYNLKSVGGGSINPLWNQIKSDILKISISTYEFQETAVLGAALLGAFGAELIDDLSEFVTRLPFQPVGQYVPNPDYSSVYNTGFEIYNSIYPMLKDHFEKLSQMQSEK
jgi:xylulokinase